MGLLCARQYFQLDTPAEKNLRARITWLWQEVEWDWYTRGGSEALYWHWSPNNDWALNHKIRGWNECLMAYVLAASAPRYPIDPVVYHNGFASGPEFLNGRSYYGIELPLGPAVGGPLFFTHYSFCGLDPRGLKRPVCRLLATEPAPCGDQSRALRRESRQLPRLWRVLLGSHRKQ